MEIAIDEEIYQYITSNAVVQLLVAAKYHIDILISYAVQSDNNHGKL